MGYTHYWRKTAAKGEPWERLVELAEKIVEGFAEKNPGHPIRSWTGDGSPEIGKSGIHLNGDETSGESCEDFFLVPATSEFTFCKTRQRPYDQVVTAILLVAAWLGVLPDGWSSDARRLADLQPGIELAKAAVPELAERGNLEKALPTNLRGLPA